MLIVAGRRVSYTHEFYSLRLTVVPPVGGVAYQLCTLILVSPALIYIYIFVDKLIYVELTLLLEQNPFECEFLSRDVHCLGHMERE